MVLEACVCNLDIEGVEQLPAHTHMTDGGTIPWQGRRGGFRDGPMTYENFVARYFPLRGEVRIWVEWKEVARQLSKEEHGNRHTSS